MSRAERQARRKKIARFCQRHTTAEACKEFGVGATLVQTACAEHDVVPLSGEPEPPRSRLRLVAALVNTRTTFSELARRHRVSRQAVQLFAAKCRDAGLKVRPRYVAGVPSK